MNERDALWEQVLKSRYLKDGVVRAEWKNKAGASNAWRGIVEVSPILKEAIRLTPRNGKATNFWNYHGLFSKLVYMHAIQEIGIEQRDKNFREYWNPAVGWKWDRIGKFFPEYVKEVLSTYSLVEDEEAHDDFCWKDENLGNFSFSSAYSHTHVNAGIPAGRRQVRQNLEN